MDWAELDRRSLDRSDWDSLIAGHSFFSAIQWIDVCTEGLGRKAHSIFLCGYEGNRLVAALPAILTRRWGVRSFYSLPYGTYGGVFWSAGAPIDSKGTALAHLSAHFRKARYARVVIADYDNSLCDWIHNGIERRPAFTHIIDLSRGEYHPPDKKIEQHIQIGLKAEPEIVPLHTASQVGEFYALYSATEARHGRAKPILPRRLFDVLFERLIGTDMLYWIGLYAAGRMIGSQINLIFGDSLINWQTVSDHDMRHFKPNHLLLMNAITYARSRGLAQVNLGASPPEAEGLIDFKERWGGVRRNYDIISLRSSGMKMLERWR